MPSPAALFEAERQRASALLIEQGAPDPYGLIASEQASTDMHGHAYDHALAAEEALETCRANHLCGLYGLSEQRCLYAAIARYIACAEFCNPDHPLSSQSSSALATFHRAIPEEQRDDEWRAVDAVLRARERRG